MDTNAIAGLIAAFGTWAAIVGAAVMLYFQNRSAQQLTFLQLFLELANRYDSDEMNRRRSRLASTLLINRESLEIDDTVLVFFENVAFMIKRHLLDRDLSWNTFGLDVCSYWSAVEHYVTHMRAVFNDPTLYSEFEWLNVYMRDTYIHGSKLYPKGRNTRAGIDPAAITAFLKMEERRYLELTENTGKTKSDTIRGLVE
jgi:hypothetical protein